MLSQLGAGSDYAGFIIVAGVPALDIRYTYNPDWPLLSYPLYHSAYETFHAVDNYIDVGFKVSKRNNNVAIILRFVVRLQISDRLIPSSHFLNCLR